MAEPAPGGAFTETGRIPPQNLEAEESVLGGILLSNEKLNEIIELLTPEDFYREKHRRAFAAMLTLSDRNEPIDLITLASELKSRQELDVVGGETFLAYLAGRVPTAANIKYYAQIVQDKSMLRRVIHTGTEIVGWSYESDAAVNVLLDRSEARFLEIGERRLKKTLLPIKEVVKHTFKHIERLMENHQDITGVPTGFADVDRLLSGLQPSDLIILAARPSMGKTSFALNIAQNAAIRYKIPVAIFSLEMGKEQLAMRMLSSEAEIDSTQLRGGFLSDEEIQRLMNAAGALTDAPVAIDDTPSLTPLELKAKARRFANQHKNSGPLGLIVVDYLQLMQAPSAQENRAQEVSEISRSLKALAKELQWPVLALSQLNRESEKREDKKPLLSNLRDSGAIEQDADVVAFIHRRERYDDDPSAKGKAELIVAKNRNGPVDNITLSFRSRYTKFGDFTNAEEYYGGQGGQGGRAAG